MKYLQIQMIKKRNIVAISVNLTKMPLQGIVIMWCNLICHCNMYCWLCVLHCVLCVVQSKQSSVRSEWTRGVGGNTIVKQFKTVWKYVYGTPLCATLGWLHIYIPRVCDTGWLGVKLAAFCGLTKVTKGSLSFSELHMKTFRSVLKIKNFCSVLKIKN